MNTAATFLDFLAGQIEQQLSNRLVMLFGPRVNDPAIGSVTWADLGILAICIVVILLIHGAAAVFFHRKKHTTEVAPEMHEWRFHFLTAIGKPLYLLIWLCGIYIAAAPLLTKHGEGNAEGPLRLLASRLFDFGIFIALLWAFFRLTRVLDVKLLAWSKRSASKVDDVFAPLAGRALRVIVPVTGILLALPAMNLPPHYAGILAQASSILIIVTVAWIVSQAVHVGEQTVLAKYDVTVPDNLRARKLYTQIHVLSKGIYFLIGVFTVASILMLFEQVRRFGTSLLASAGVVGVIAGFAAQRTIANLFAGFQIAMAQPIRLDDVVVVEGEFGNVEEITLTYVVLKLWDERRLVVPLSNFIEKPFQNWTRASSNLLGAVTLFVDYSLPVDEIRTAVQQIVENSALWDKRFWNLQVTDATERTMQLRVLVTAGDSGQLWNLRCEVREKLIAFVLKNHPQCLPLLRLMEMNEPEFGLGNDGRRSEPQVRETRSA
jgi:small-conductance mechanosensitive channel